MTVYCHACGSRNVRPSLLQLRDLFSVLTLRHPVRCRYCRNRFHVSIFKIRKVRRDANARRAREDRDQFRSQAVFLDLQPFEDPR